MKRLAWLTTMPAMSAPGDMRFTSASPADNNSLHVPLKGMPTSKQAQPLSENRQFQFPPHSLTVFRLSK